MTLLTLCMHLDRKRIASILGYRLEVFNEMTVMSLLYLMKGFAFLADDGHAQNFNGWFYLALLFICTLIGAIIFITAAVKRLIFWFKYKFLRKKWVIDLKQKLGCESRNKNEQ